MVVKDGKLSVVALKATVRAMLPAAVSMPIPIGKLGAGGMDVAVPTPKVAPLGSTNGAM